MKVKSLSILRVPLMGPCAGPDRLKKGGQRPVNKYRNTRCFGAFLYGDGIGAALLLCFADWLNLANILYDGRDVFDRR